MMGSQNITHDTTEAHTDAVGDIWGKFMSCSLQATSYQQFFTLIVSLSYWSISFWSLFTIGP